MAKLCLKKPSKRMPCRKRYKIEKKIREHNRKKRKEAKKHSKKPSKKLIHVPNICPFKEEILKDVEEYKKHVEIEKQREKEIFKAEKLQQRTKNFVDLLQSSEKRQMEHETKGEMNEDSVSKQVSTGQSKTYYREFHKVVEAADVILEVVDARDPLGTRCINVEQTVREAGDGKRLILVLNKADLVSHEILQRWLKYLRRSVPCIPFKSSTQMQNQKLGRRKLKKKQDIESGGVCVGAEGLTSLLANYSRNKGIKTSIRVGVVGLPNVGKSSLINSLKRSRACKVGAVPGVTRTLQEVQLDSKIKLLDSPGLAFASSDDPQAVLKNVVHSSDPIEPAEMIISRAQKEHLMTLYAIPSFNTFTECLTSLAKRHGRYKKGGILDLNAAASILINDWNRGKIPYHTEPPEEDTSYDISSSFVTANVAEFNLENYDKTFTLKEEPMDVSSEPKEKLTNGNFVVSLSKKKARRGKRGKGKKKENENAQSKKTDSLMEIEGNQKLNKIKKLKFKKEKKEKARDRKTDDSLAGIMGDIKL